MEVLSSCVCFFGQQAKLERLQEAAEAAGEFSSEADGGAHSEYPALPCMTEFMLHFICAHFNPLRVVSLLCAALCRWTERLLMSVFHFRCNSLQCTAL